jgi:CubicO group peptidase (beta-lactamase class C family)
MERNSVSWFFVFVLLLAGTASSGDDWSITFPGASWQTKTPAELGLDGTKLNQFATNVGGVGCIIRQGYLVKTWGAADSKDHWASAGKPVTSTMLFYAVEEGLLTDVHELIEDHGWDLITKDEPMEFYHLANMTGGYARGEAPGAAWAYNDYGITLYMKTLFGNVYGTTANTAATNPNRLGALQFQDGSIFQTVGIYEDLLYTSPRDFARIGWFWCNRGFWNGNQLLPKHYFDDYMQTQVPGSMPRTTIAGTDYLGIGTYGGMEPGTCVCI